MTTRRLKKYLWNPGSRLWGFFWVMLWFWTVKAIAWFWLGWWP